LTRIYHILRKEFLVIGRDIHAVAVLFIMPTVFILIMSLAMQDLFDIHGRVRMDVLVIDQDGQTAARQLFESLDSENNLSLHRLDPGLSAAEVTRIMFEKDYKFGLVITNRFTPYAESKDSGEGRQPLLLLVNPTAGTHTQMVMKNIIAGHMAKIRVRNFVKDREPLLKLAGIDRQKLLESPETQIGVQYAYKNGQSMKIPNAVQQSVPAWLVFSMFFIVMPISNTFIVERTQGSLARLKSINIPSAYLIGGKIAPYFLINLVQAALMILIGMYVVPLLGGGALTLGRSWGGLLLMTASISFCAISVALFVASISRTTEQAVTIGGVSNIILAAVGGIMIPKFVMPVYMQKLADISPMSWGLEGFLDIFLRNGNIGDVWPKALALLGLGMVMLALTSVILKRSLTAS
jgi:ABC-2 type transport system permease protein